MNYSQFGQKKKKEAVRRLSQSSGRKAPFGRGQSTSEIYSENPGRDRQPLGRGKFGRSKYVIDKRERRYPGGPVRPRVVKKHISPLLQNQKPDSATSTSDQGMPTAKPFTSPETTTTGPVFGTLPASSFSGTSSQPLSQVPFGVSKGTGFGVESSRNIPSFGLSGTQLESTPQADTSSFSSKFKKTFTPVSTVSISSLSSGLFGTLPSQSGSFSALSGISSGTSSSNAFLPSVNAPLFPSAMASGTFGSGLVVSSSSGKAVSAEGQTESLPGQSLFMPGQSVSISGPSGFSGQTSSFSSPAPRFFSSMGLPQNTAPISSTSVVGTSSALDSTITNSTFGTFGSFSESTPTFGVNPSAESSKNKTVIRTEASSTLKGSKSYNPGGMFSKTMEGMKDGRTKQASSGKAKTPPKCLPNAVDISNCTSLIVKQIPNELNNNRFLSTFFSKFGKVNVRCNPSRASALLMFSSHVSGLAWYSRP